MKRSAILEMLLLGALWGASFLFMRVAAPVLGPVWLIELRVLIGGLALVPLLIRTRSWDLIRRYAPIFFLLGIFNAAIPFLLFAYAALSLPAGFTAILNATTPLFGTVVAFFWLRERLTPARAIGFGLGFLGVIILVGWQTAGITPEFLLAVGAGLIAALLYAIVAPFTKRYLDDVPSLITSTMSHLSAAVFLLPALPFTVPSQPISAAVILSVLLLALGSTSLAYILYFRLIHTIGATNTLTVAYLVPLFAILWGALILQEPITLSMGLGGGLVIAGIAIAYANSKVA